MTTMTRISPTLPGFARCFLLVGLSGSALLACDSEPTPENGGGAGTGTTMGGSAGTGTTGGSAPQAGTATSAGTASGGSSAGTSTGGGSGGSGGSGGGTGGSSSGGAGGSGGGAGGSGGAPSGGGGAGGGGAVPTAVATIMGLNGQTVTGTATFTQGATMTKLVLNLTACPAGPHSSHLHLTKDCADNGNAAGGHWVPNGEMLGNYTCADNKVTHEVSKPIGTWTVGDGGANDVTKYAFMVHEMGDPSSGGRIGCGVINKQ